MSRRQRQMCIRDRLLPIPSDLKDVNSVKYDTSTLNGLQAVGAAAVEGGSEAVSDIVSSFFPGGNENNERQTAIDELVQVGTDTFSDVVGGVGSEKAANNFLRKRFASQIVGIFGCNVTASQLLARGNGEIINPNM